MDRPATAADRPGRRFVVLFLLVLATVQVVQGVLVRPGLPYFQKSYWLVTYQFGFTRRGLGGEAFRVLTGSLPTDREIDVTAWVIAALTIGLVLLLAIELIRRRSTSLDLVAVLLVTSPFVIDFVVFQRRPDQLGLAVVVAFALACTRFPGHLIVCAAVGGLALAVAVFVQDVVLLECVPWVLVIALLAGRRAGSSWTRSATIVVLACAPAVLAGLVSLSAGRASASMVEQLTATAASGHPWVTRPDAGPVILGFLDDDLRTSSGYVTSLQPTSVKVGSVLVGVVLLAAEGIAAWLAVSGSVRRRSASRDSILGTAMLGSALGLTVVGLGLLLALGTDWARWFAVYGFMAMVTFAFWSLSGPTPDQEDRGRSWRPPVVLAIAMFGLWLAPLGDAFSARDALHYLFMVPR